MLQAHAHSTNRQTSAGSLCQLAESRRAAGRRRAKRAAASSLWRAVCTAALSPSQPPLLTAILKPVTVHCLLLSFPVIGIVLLSLSELFFSTSSTNFGKVSTGCDESQDLLVVAVIPAIVKARRQTRITSTTMKAED